MSNFNDNRVPERECFICGSSKGCKFQEETLDIAGLGSIERGFRVCLKCDLVLQDPIVPKKLMMKYYSEFSNYTNPANSGKPSDSKMKAVRSQLNYLSGTIDGSEKCFQVGASDGYTLSQFREIGLSVSGCDPSEAAAKVAEEHYDLTIAVSAFEDYEISDSYGLIILTHVLEHLYDPYETLMKCSEMLEDSGKIFIEVPLLAEEKYLPPGYFSFEHVNYFTVESLVRLLNSAGFMTLKDVEVDYESDQYPIQRVIAEKGSNVSSYIEPAGRARSVNDIVFNYQEVDASLWNAFEEKVDSFLREFGEDVIVWGGGIHTSILFERTNVKSKGNILSIIDSDPQKMGAMLSGYEIKSPESVLSRKNSAVIVISTLGGERAIYDTLKGLGWDMQRVCCFYGADE